MKIILRLLLIVICLLLALLSYDALVNVHYDIDLTSVLAQILGISLRTLGVVSGILSLLLLLRTVMTFWPQNRL